MTKADLINEMIIADPTMTKAMATRALNNICNTISKTVIKGENVTLTGFGTFSKKDVKARTGRNPQTGEELTIKAHSKVSFKAGKTFKEAIK